MARTPGTIRISDFSRISGFGFRIFLHGLILSNLKLATSGFLSYKYFPSIVTDPT